MYGKFSEGSHARYAAAVGMMGRGRSFCQAVVVKLELRSMEREGSRMPEEQQQSGATVRRMSRRQRRMVPVVKHGSRHVAPPRAQNAARYKNVRARIGKQTHGTVSACRNHYCRHATNIEAKAVRRRVVRTATQAKR